MGLGGFLKAIWRGIQKVLPFLGAALDNDVIKLILISKFGEKIVSIIRELVRFADEMDGLDNDGKHAYVRAEFLRERPPGVPVSNSDLDVHIKMAVKELRGEGSIQVPKNA